ncbi:MAG: fimbrillin family protein [Paraprevotella sp.]|nr:fimbrillin family protein [Paraprevotella sp.]
MKYAPGKAVMMSVALCALFVSSCHEELETESGIDREWMVKTGKWLSATRPGMQVQTRDAATRAVAAVEEGYTLFEQGTKYRLLGFVRPEDNLTAPLQFRFNEQATEAVGSSVHFVDVPDAVDNLGFTAHNGETGSADEGHCAISFYGFTFGTTADVTLSDLPSSGSPVLSDVYYNETNGTHLQDLMWGRLQDVTEAVSVSYPSEIPFQHAYSQLKIKVGQQANEEGENMFSGLVVTGVKVPSHPTQGKVYLEDGSVWVNTSTKGDISLEVPSPVTVTTKAQDLGAMIVLPTTDLKDVDPYTFELDVTVQGPQDVLQTFAVNNGGTASDVTPVGNTYQLTLKKNPVMSSTSASNSPLYLKPGYSYTLDIEFMDNSMRIITAMPMKEEWLFGETDHYKVASQGQPQFFDNRAWSDRNLGADEYDASGGFTQFAKTMGYFYQGLRNIPYWPFNFKDANYDHSLNLWVGKGEDSKGKGYPNPYYKMYLPEGLTGPDIAYSSGGEPEIWPVPDGR